MPEQTDANSFEQIYADYADAILNLAWRMTADEDTARDLTQDIFVKVYRSLESFEGRSSVYTWLYRIAVNHIYNYLKKEKRKRWVDLLDSTVGEAIWGNEAESGGPQAPDPAADRLLEDSERAEVVWRAVTDLPPKYRVPIVLYHYQGMSYKEIAETAGISMSAVEARIHRGRKKLVKLLEPWIDRI
ncbi:MAG: sigma-70 family RNA polymerase sigma factor [Candidatus Latescibacterota bacterium]